MKNFLDFQLFLINPSTFLIVFICLLAITQHFALLRQSYTMFKNGSAESVSPVFFFWQFFFFLSLLIFGYYNESLPALIFGSLFITSIPITIMIFMFKKRKLETFLSFVSGFSIIYLFLNVNSIPVFLLILFLMFTLALLSQVFIIQLNKTRGDLDLLFVLSSFTCAIFSWLYSSALDNFMLQLFTGLVLVAFSSIYFLYKKYA